MFRNTCPYVETTTTDKNVDIKISAHDVFLK